METHTQELKAVGLTGTGASLHPGWKLVLSPQTDPQPPVVVLESPSHMGTTQGQAPAFQQVDRLLGAQVTASEKSACLCCMRGSRKQLNFKGSHCKAVVELLGYWWKFKGKFLLLIRDCEVC